MKRDIALAAIALLFLLGAAFQSPNAIKGPRKFYLTKTTHNGAQTLSACAKNYHMASLWEIHEPSTLLYDTELGFTAADSGAGAPTGEFGWIRTGSPSLSNFAVPGRSNCNVWTESAEGVGTGVFLHTFWATPGPAPSGGDSVTVVDPWLAITAACGSVNRVWCVQD